jgi:plasmid stabilization system protein ParE
MSFRVLPKAARDIAEAAVWYEDQRAGLGLEFNDAVKAAFRRIESGPARYPFAYGSYRRAVLRRFPYTIYYRAASADIVIYAVMHPSRDQKVLRDRLN